MLVNGWTRTVVALLHLIRMDTELTPPQTLPAQTELVLLQAPVGSHAEDVTPALAETLNSFNALNGPCAPTLAALLLQISSPTAGEVDVETLSTIMLSLLGMRPELFHFSPTETVAQLATQPTAQLTALPESLVLAQPPTKTHSPPSAPRDHPSSEQSSQTSQLQDPTSTLPTIHLIPLTQSFPVLPCLAHIPLVQSLS
jgi:hypothetical protein